MTAVALKKDALIVNPETGYNQVAPYYDSWHWSQFWKANEAPIVASWLNTVSKGTVLDAGSGTGCYRALIERMGLAYIGVDLSSYMLEIGAQKAREVGDNASAFHLGDIRQIPLSSESVDAVLCTRVLSHIEDAKDAFKEFKRVLRSDSLAIISDIHPAHPYEHTGIKVPSGKVTIETHKHNMNHLIDVVKTLGGLEVLSVREYKVADLMWKPDVRFSKLSYRPQHEVFYTLALRKK